MLCVCVYAWIDRIGVAETSHQSPTHGSREYNGGPRGAPQSSRVLLGLERATLQGAGASSKWRSADLSKKKLSTLWGDVLGVPYVSAYKAKNVDEDIHMLGKGTFAVEVDLMQPLDPEKALKVHIPALNHIGLWVDDLASAVEHLESQGISMAPGGIGAGHLVTTSHSSTQNPQKVFARARAGS